MRNVNPTKLTVNRMRQDDDEISLSQITFSLADEFFGPTVFRYNLKPVKARDTLSRVLHLLPKDYESLGYLIHRACVKTTRSLKCNPYY